MRKLLFILVFLSVPSLALAQPSMVFDSEDVDFGEVDSGAVLEHVFEFVNTGTEELVIESIKPS